MAIYIVSTFSFKRMKELHNSQGAVFAISPSTVRN